MGEHSPGPWKTFAMRHGVAGPRFAVVRDMKPRPDLGDGVAAGEFVADVRDERNMELIAAAPEMLELLREGRRWLEDPSANSDDYIDRLEALLARLDGVK